MKTKPTVSIGIPAFNEEANIGCLINDILGQSSEKYIIQNIIISLDGSTDSTATVIKNIHSSYIDLIVNKDRKGKGRGLNQIIKRCKSDILILFDADIRLGGKRTIEKFISPISNKSCDLVSPQTKAFRSGTYVNNILFNSIRIKQRIYNSINKGNNIYNCFGMAMGLSKNLYSQLTIPGVAGDDMYIYWLNIQRGGLFEYVEDCSVYYNLPSNITDYLKQSTRFFASIKTMNNYISKGIFQDEFHIPFKSIIKFVFPVIAIIFSHPILSLGYIVLLSTSRIKSFSITHINDAWLVAESTKKRVYGQ